VEVGAIPELFACSAAVLTAVRRHTRILALAAVDPPPGRHIDTLLLIGRPLSICFISILAALLPSASVAWSRDAASPVSSVKALLETTPVPDGGDAADDAAIWVDTARPGRSSIIATDKLGGLAVYDLSGRQLHYYADSRPNNVDLRAGFRLGGRRVSLVATSDTKTDSIRVYAVEPSNRSLRYVAARPLSTGIGVAGLCMYRSARSGKYFVFVSDSSGTLQQWELFDNGQGRVESRKVRTLELDSVTEGCVADDALGRLYIAQEDVAIWRYRAEPNGGATRVEVDSIGAHLAADIEGLAIYAPRRGAGYLIASSQGSDSFAVYRRAGSNAYAMSFRVVSGRVDGVTHTDGIAVAARRLSPRFSTGVFVAQDDRNDRGNQNFKLVSWSTIGRLARRASPTRYPSVVRRARLTYYVDALAGNDTNAGTSVRRPWKTLERASSAPLQPGDRLLLRRGRAWAGALTVRASGVRSAPIVIGPYARGPMPRITGGSSCVVLSGSYLVLRKIHADDCSWAGSSVSGDHDRVEQTLMTHNVAGIYVTAGADANAIVGNELRDNDKMTVLTPTPSDDDSGAFGIALHGDDNEVAFNTISGSDAFSYDFGRDGAAVEVYGGRRNTIHHNLAIDNDAFSELGDARTAGTTFSYNVVRSALRSSVGLVTRGAKSGGGPVTGTRFYQNTISLSGALSQGFVCHGGCGPNILRMRNTIIWAAGKVGFADNDFDEDYDLFFGAKAQFTTGRHSITVNPAFVNRRRGNLHLRGSSRAVDRGVELGYSEDFDRRRARVDGNRDGRAVPDIGAFEYRRPPR
jgi:3-phytase